MFERKIEERQNVLPKTGDTIAAAYINAHPNLSYRERFVQLIQEAKRAFIFGCPLSSIIASGEALLRIVYDRIAIIYKYSLDESGNVRKDAPQLSTAAQNRLHDLSKPMTFKKALDFIEGTKLFPDEVVIKMRVVKDLRNDAAHGDLPILNTWEPPVAPAELSSFLRGEAPDPPEAYHFISNLNDKTECIFRPGDHECSSLRALTTDEHYAAIQYLLVIEIVRFLSSQHADVRMLLAERH